MLVDESWRSNETHSSNVAINFSSYIGWLRHHESNDDRDKHQKQAVGAWLEKLATTSNTQRTLDTTPLLGTAKLDMHWMKSKRSKECYSSNERGSESSGSSPHLPHLFSCKILFLVAGIIELQSLARKDTRKRGEHNALPCFEPPLWWLELCGRTSFRVEYARGKCGFSTSQTSKFRWGTSVASTHV